MARTENGFKPHQNHPFFVKITWGENDAKLLTLLEGVIISLLRTGLINDSAQIEPMPGTSTFTFFFLNINFINLLLIIQNINSYLFEKGIIIVVVIVINKIFEDHEQIIF